MNFHMPTTIRSLYPHRSDTTSKEHDNIVNKHRLNERVIRRQLMFEWNEKTQQVFLKLICQHRGFLTELIHRPNSIISPNEFHYYNGENDRLIQDATLVQELYKRKIYKEKQQKKKGGRRINKALKIRKEIQHEICYLIMDIDEFKQTFSRQQQQQYQENNDGKEETAENTMLFHMSIAERKLMYKNVFQELLVNGDSEGDDEDDGNDNYDECAICLEDISSATTIVHSKNTQCKHTYCEDCIVDYFSNKERHLRVVLNEPTSPCPICRREYCSIIINN